MTKYVLFMSYTWFDHPLLYRRPLVISPEWISWIDFFICIFSDILATDEQINN